MNSSVFVNLQFVIIKQVDRMKRNIYVWLKRNSNSKIHWFQFNSIRIMSLKIPLIFQKKMKSKSSLVFSLLSLFLPRSTEIQIFSSMTSRLKIWYSSYSMPIEVFACRRHQRKSSIDFRSNFRRKKNESKRSFTYRL